jgi:REP element-mobilizing transposase RayT
MPDHIHLLIVLGERLSLGKAVARLKAKTRAALAVADAALEWERDFFDRHIRPDEDRLSLFLYLYLKPYRANLCAQDRQWPYFYCRSEDWIWFKDMLDFDRPVPEWLA